MRVNLWSARGLACAKMGSCVCWCLLLAVLLGFGWAQNSDVIELDGANFDESIGDLDIVLVEFYAPW